jgi:adenylylsulfate kinase
MAKWLCERREIILDGNALRDVWPGLGFSQEDRWEQNLRAARLAKLLDDQGFNVIVATICPYRALRDEVQAITHCRFVQLSGGKEPSEEYPYER